jgi:DHA1 family inner membrane transport protein
VATAASGLAVGIIESSVVFFAAMALWGFAFWMAVPASLQMLAERSVTPSERMGDAQASMAMGRVVGPVVGGLALGAGAFARLSWVGAMVMIGSGLIVAMVEVYRRTAPPLPELRSSDLG